MNATHDRYCNAAPHKRRTKVLIYSDAAYIVLMSVFAVSNGYLGNISMIHGPKAFESKPHQGRELFSTAISYLHLCDL